VARECKGYPEGYPAGLLGTGWAALWSLGDLLAQAAAAS